MTGFEPRTSGIGSNCSTNWATQPLPDPSLLHWRPAVQWFFRQRRVFSTSPLTIRAPIWTIPLQRSSWTPRTLFDTCTPTAKTGLAIGASIQCTGAATFTSTRLSTQKTKITIKPVRNRRDQVAALLRPKTCSMRSRLASFILEEANGSRYELVS